MVSQKRKTLLQSKRKPRIMMELFESKIDDEIILIDVDNNRIQGKNGCYKVDIKANKVEKMFRCQYQFVDRGDEF